MTSQWRLDDGVLSLDVVLPPGVTGVREPGGPPGHRSVRHGASGRAGRRVFRRRPRQDGRGQIVIRVGLVGAGPWAEMFTAPLLAQAPDLSLAGVWARRPEAAAAVARQHDSVAVDTFEALLDECDAVAFNVPPDVQASLAVTAAEAGKHLLLEKPVAFSVADAEAVAAAADSAGVATQLMLTYRFTDQVKAFVAETSRSKVEYFRSRLDRRRCARGSVRNSLAARAASGPLRSRPARPRPGRADRGAHRGAAGR